MHNPVTVCADCGNPRNLMALDCPFCGSSESFMDIHSKWQCHVMNLESNMPLVEEAFERIHHHLEKLRGRGLRAIKVIHGHGSSGRGGKIRREFRQAMEYGLWGEAIIEVYFGEMLLPHLPQYQDLLKTYPALKNSITKDMQGNPGITLLILDKNY